MLHRDVGRAGDEEEGCSVLVPARVLNRYIECECVGILEQASSCLCEGMLVNKGALCPDKGFFSGLSQNFGLKVPVDHTSMLLQELTEDRKAVGQFAQRGCAVFIPGYFYIWLKT